MGLGSGPGEYPEGVPVEGQADRGALVDIEGDGIGQQCDRVVELRRPPTQLGQGCCGTRQPCHIPELPLQRKCRHEALLGHLKVASLQRQPPHGFPHARQRALLTQALIESLGSPRVLQPARIAVLLVSRGDLDVQGQPGQQVFGSCQLLEGHSIVGMLAQVTLETLVRLGQEVGGADEVSYTHIHGGLVVEQAGGEHDCTGGDEAVTARLQLTERALQRCLIANVIADPRRNCRQLLDDLQGGIVRERRLGCLQRC